MRTLIMLVISVITIFIAVNTNYAVQDIKVVYRISLEPGQGAGGYYNQHKYQKGVEHELSSSW